ncbi:MAG: TonB-dependent receptor [Xanthomonadales bacterium]|nr:TonB-dependent receptor [Xanthomonadales bacterium]
MTTHVSAVRAFFARGVHCLMSIAVAGLVSTAVNVPAHAQSQSAQDDDDFVIEEIVVVGTRRTIQNSINLKRASTEIVDGLNADEIGELPALSIGEALESITAAATHRENGGATEVAIRGMGPFLGTTVVNGRESTNGSGNRAVNFSIFPSEMFNKIAVHKTQSASYIEGAVSGQVHLDTRRPIEYGDQRVQFSLKGSAHPDDRDIAGQDEFGYRATASYINSWDTDYGTFGISIGGQKREDSNPEAEATHTTGGGRLEACELESFDSNAQPRDTSGRCDENGSDPDLSNDQVGDLIALRPEYNSVDDIPFAYIPRDRTFRRNTTNDNRDAIFAAFQWQPNDNWDIMLDFQASERDQKELRQDLQFGSTQNNLTNLVSDPRTGLIQSFITDTDIRSNTTDFTRFEEYEGGGLNITWQATDALEISFDAAIADTKRTETDIEVRMAATEVLVTDPEDIGSREEFLVSFDVNAPGTDGLALPTVLTQDNGDSIGTFDITDPRYFSARDRARIRAREQIRENTIDAYRLDLSWDKEVGPIYNMQAGVRFATLEYRTFGGNRSRAGLNLFEDEDFDGVPNGSSSTDEARNVVFNAANNCGQSSFPEPGFLSESLGGNNLVTVAGGTGTGTAWATFDHGCLLDELLANYGGRSAIQLQNGLETSSIDLTEDTTALYLQANYESEMFGKPVRGNFGVRVVETEVDSIGRRRELSVVEGIDPNDGSPEFFILEASADAPLEEVTQSNSYTEVLPSFTFIMDLSDDWVLRAGAFRGISRPDPHSYSNARNIDTSDGTDPGTGFDSLEEAVEGIRASGNPQLEPLPSINLDLAVEWYANQDTLLAAGVYWKEFQGGFENAFQREDFLIDGNVVSGFVRTTQVSDEKSELKGFELSATHSFGYLPGFWGGFGATLSYNYADSDFEFEDGNGGDGVAFDSQGNPSQLIGILDPAGLWGLSRHTAATRLYWQNDRFNVQAIYKTRSEYFQGYGRDTTARVRYVDDYDTLDLRFSYDVTDNITASLEGINVLSEPRVDFRAIPGEVVQTLEYGPRVFLGLRAKF